MAPWVTHREIVEYLADNGITVTVQAVSNWGAKGYFGKSDGGFPKRFEWSKVKLGLANIPDHRKRLSDKQVRMIRKRSTEPLAMLASEFGVSESYVSLIIAGKRRAAA